MLDFDFSEQSCFTVVTPLNDTAQQHLEENTDGMWFADGLCVETRYAPDLAAQLCHDGFTVELPDGRVVTAADLRA